MIVTSSVTLFHRLVDVICFTAAALHTRLYRSIVSPAADQHDVTSGSITAPPPSENRDHTATQSSEITCVEAANNSESHDMTSQATSGDVSMTCAVCDDVDVTSYSLLSASDVSQILQVSAVDDVEETRISTELREISRDLADMRAHARLVSVRCHDDRWLRGDALTLGVTEALTPRASLQPTHAAACSHWPDSSTLLDWPLDESALDCQPHDSRRDVILSDCSDRKLSMTSACAAAELMTSSPADDSVADIYIDDELDDVIA